MTTRTTVVVTTTVDVLDVRAVIRTGTPTDRADRADPITLAGTVALADRADLEAKVDPVVLAVPAVPVATLLVAAAAEVAEVVDPLPLLLLT